MAHNSTEKYNKRKKVLTYSVGKACRTYREQCGISQRKLAKIFGVSQNFISNFERGLVDSLFLACLYNNYFDYQIFDGDNTDEYMFPF